MRSRDFIHRGGLWVVAQSALLLAVLVLAPAFGRAWKSRGVAALGALLFVVGGWLGLAGVRALGRNRTAYPKPLTNSALVQSGVYGVLRHPLYSSLMFASAGWALWWASWAGLAAAGALTALLAAKAAREERWLRERYPEYREYERRVKRFVPGVW
jgi:protein-S-isoprenylcysteine O-methyltransferase Ste14